MQALKNYHTTIAALLIALAAFLGSGIAVEFSPGAVKYFHLAAGIFTAIGLVLAKDALPGAPASAPVAAAGPSAAAKLGAKFGAALAMVLLVVGLSGCTKAQADAVFPVVRDISGAICPIVLQDVIVPANPAAARLPICTTLAEIEAATQALLGKEMVGAKARPLTDAERYDAVVAYRASKAAAK